MPGKIIVYKAIQDDGTSYWSDAFPIKKLNEWQVDMGPVSFASQFQSSPIDYTGNYLKRSWLNWYDKSEKPELFDKIITFIDPAISQKNSADFFAMATGGLANNKVYMLSLIRTKVPLEQQIELVKDNYAIYAPDVIVIEAGGPQKYFIENVKLSTMFNIQEPNVNWHRSDKKTKFESAAAHFNSSRALLPGYKDDLQRWMPIDEFGIFVEEWTSFPDATHDDTLDAVSGVIASMIDSVTAASSIESNDIDQVKKFIEETIYINEDRNLTKEEEQALNDYYSDNGIGIIRRDGSGHRMIHF